MFVYEIKMERVRANERGRKKKKTVERCKILIANKKKKGEFIDLSIQYVNPGFGRMPIVSALFFCISKYIKLPIQNVW